MNIAPHKPRIVFLVNGDQTSAMAIRARAFSERLGGRFEIRTCYRNRRKLAAAAHFLGVLLRTRPQVCYVFDLAWPGVVAGLLFRLISPSRIAVDTGDAIYELAKAMGRNPMGLVLTRLLEWAALRFSDAIIVRSHFHRDWLRARGIEAEVIPDGVDTAQFDLPADAQLMHVYNPDAMPTIGTLGSLTWNARTGHCYGLEILEAVRDLKDLNVKGVIIGDGSGLPELRRRARDYGIEDRIVFTGRIPYSELPRYLKLIDVCVSTQTNDLPGQVRTTGKLPLYLAAGRCVLATKVGEAARILPDELLVPYQGAFDPEYPRRLTDAVRGILRNRPVDYDPAGLAKRHFDYNLLAERLQSKLHSLCAAPVLAAGPEGTERL